MNEKTMQKLTYGLFVLTSNDGNKDNGCIINTAMQLTSDPNKIAIAVNKANYSHDIIMKTKKFNVCILSEEAQFSLFQRFGFQSGRTVNKFDGFQDYKKSLNDLPVITKGANSYISAWVEQTVDVGTHTLFIATVTDMDILNDVPSASYAYYHQHIKPQPQQSKTEKTGWRCKICGFIYEGEELPADYICPICKHPASDFEKI